MITTTEQVTESAEKLLCDGCLSIGICSIPRHTEHPQPSGNGLLFYTGGAERHEIHVDKHF